MPHRGVALQSFSDTNASPPPGLDPQQFPVLAAHYFGVDPIANDGDTPALRDLRIWRHVELLHRRGPRALLEFLTAVGVERNITTFLEDEISAFADLDALEAIREVEHEERDRLVQALSEVSQ